MIDEACADLKLANGYLAAIQQELSRMCDEEAKLPEIDPEAILGVLFLHSLHPSTAPCSLHSCTT